MPRDAESGSGGGGGVVSQGAGAGAAGPWAVRLSDGAAFYVGAKEAQLPAALVGGRLDVNLGAQGGFDLAANVTDRDARLLGRAKILDSAGAVIDPALKGQLPAALSGGRLDVAIGAPVTLGRVDVNAALAAGSQVRVFDGTDELTILPVRTQPATTEKTAVVTELPNRLATYACVTTTITPAITVGVKELLAIWNGAEAKDKYLVELWATGLVTTAGTAGRSAIRVSTITSAPTGGTELGKVDISGAGASGMTNTMQVKTGGGAIGTTFIRKLVEWTTQTVGRIDVPLFVASNPGNGIILRGGANAGISIDIEREVAHTALVDLWTIGARWIEL